MSIPANTFSQEIKSFISEHKALCVLTLGLAIVGFSIGKLVGRTIAWIKHPAQAAKKADEKGQEILRANTQTT